MSAPATATGHELSLGQEALWFLQQLAPGSSAYNVSGALNLHFPVDAGRMAAAVEQTVSGHATLNCVFRMAGGEVRRFGAGTGAAALQVHEVAGDDRSVRDYALGWAQQPFRLDAQVPIRVALLRRDRGADVLLMAAHHITMDYASQVLVLREILDRYAGVAGTATDSGAAYDGFVRQQRRYLDSPRAAAARRYWRTELEQAVPGDLPTDAPRPAVYTFAGAEVDFQLPPGVLARVRRAAAAQNATPFAFLFAAFQLLLYARSGQTDLLLGYPVSLRAGRQLRDSIGYYVNTLPFHARVDPGGSFGALLHRTGGKLLRALMYRDYPFALMPRLVQAGREPDRAGLFSTMFVMTYDVPDDPLSAAQAPGTRVELAGLLVSEFYLPQQQGQFDVTLQVAPGSGQAQLKYNTSLFTVDTARELAAGYLAVLRSAADGTLPARLREVRAGIPDEGA
ncbi:MAG TPA: condensation domain-containing protein [Rugosimonospora sp.]|nr:condensation domain-containing protein [Rugosimonospora sp.]